MATKKLQLMGVKLVNEEDYGKSAYELAVDHGFEGTEEEWLESLKADVTLDELGGVAEAELADKVETIIDNDYANTGPIWETMDTVARNAAEYVIVEKLPVAVIEDKIVSINPNDDKLVYSKVIDDEGNVEEHQVTPEQVGAAPAGYGLGGPATVITDWNAAVENGFYTNYADTTDENAPFPGEIAWGYTISHNLTESITQVAFAHLIVDDRQGLYQKVRSHNIVFGWGEWEWVNPPMLIGVEYRTTERLEGKPVYTMFYSGGASATNLRISAPTGATNLLRYKVWCKKGLLPIGDPNKTPYYAYTYLYSNNPGAIEYYADAKSDGYGNGTFLRVQAWYIKE